TRLIAREYAGRPRELIGAIFGLERDYFVYTLFGPLYEVQAILGKQSGGTTLEDELPVPAASEGSLALASLLAQGLEPIRNHLDKVCYYLPSLLVKCDAEVCQAAGEQSLRWLKVHERSYRGILSAVQPVAAEIRMLRELLL